MNNDSLKVFVKKIPALPTLPVIAQEILMLIDDDLVSANKLEHIIEKDPAISLRILSLANSAFWGIASVRTLGDAVFRIGFNNVRYLAVGVSLMTLFDNKKHMKADYHKIFNHSVAVGFIAKLLSMNIQSMVSEEILINGMLHDIGILVLSRYFPDSYAKVTDLAAKGKPLIEAEKTVLDFTHAEIGSWLAEEWKLPRTIIDTTLYHHEPSLAERNLLQVAVVHLADFLTTKSVLRATAHDPQYSLDPACIDMLGMSDSDLNRIESQIKSGELFSGLFV